MSPLWSWLTLIALSVGLCWLVFAAEHRAGPFIDRQIDKFLNPRDYTTERREPK